MVLDRNDSKQRPVLLTMIVLILAVFGGCQDVGSNPKVEPKFAKDDNIQVPCSELQPPVFPWNLQSVSEDASVSWTLDQWQAQISHSLIQKKNNTFGPLRLTEFDLIPSQIKASVMSGTSLHYWDGNLLDLILEDFAATKSRVAQCKEVTWLRCAITTPADLEWIAGLKGLKGLSLYGDFGGNETVSLRPLGQLENLKWLQIDFVAAALTEYPRLPSLEVLDLPRATDQSIGWPGLSKLKAISLRNSNLSDTGFRSLASSFPDLTYLDLYSTHSIGTNSCIEIEKLVNLKFLDIGLSGIRYDDLQQLRARLPNCRISTAD